MTTVTEDGGRENIYAKEPQMYLQEITVNHNERAEKLKNAWHQRTPCNAWCYRSMQQLAQLIY